MGHPAIPSPATSVGRAPSEGRGGDPGRRGEDPHRVWRSVFVFTGTEACENCVRAFPNPYFQILVFFAWWWTTSSQSAHLPGRGKMVQHRRHTRSSSPRGTKHAGAKPGTTDAQRYCKRARCTEAKRTTPTNGGRTEEHGSQTTPVPGQGPGADPPEYVLGTPGGQNRLSGPVRRLFNSKSRPHTHWFLIPQMVSLGRG